MQRLLEAARRVRVESPNPLESFLRLDPSSNGTVSRIDFDQTLRVFGIASKVDRDLLCRRFELGHWTCDYLDFCRFVEISDNAALRHLLLQLSIEDLHFDDPLRSGFVGPKKFRDALSNNSSLTELQLQLMTSRFTHPTDANRVGYRQLLDEARECQYPERRRRWRDPALEDDYDDDLQSLDGWIDHTSVKSPNRWKPKAANGSSSWPVKSKSRVKLGCSVEELCTKLNHNRWVRVRSVTLVIQFVFRNVSSVATRKTRDK